MTVPSHCRALIVLIVTLGASAQESPKRPPNTYHFTPTAADAAPSQLHADGTVTFRLSAPKAAAVAMSLGSPGPPSY